MNHANSRQEFQFLLDTSIVCLFSVAFGIIFCGWSLLYSILNPFLRSFGAEHLLTGFWMISAVCPALVVKRPFMAILGSVVASLVESLISQWGVSAILWGLVQGLGAEIIFALGRYQKWNIAVVIIAAMSSALFGFILSYFYYNYAIFPFWYNLIQISTSLFSAALLAGLPSWSIYKRLIKSGVLK